MPSEIVIPLFPLGLVLLPRMPLPLHIFEERYKLMIAECLERHTAFGIVFINGSDIQAIGCTARILKVLKRYSDGRLDILTRGAERFLIKDIYDRKPYLEGRVNFFEDGPEADGDKGTQLARNAITLLEKFTAMAGMEDGYGFAKELDAGSISFLIAGCEGFSMEEKQRFLEMTSTYKRLEECIASLEKIIERTRITEQIRKVIGGNGDGAKVSS